VDDHAVLVLTINENLKAVNPLILIPLFHIAVRDNIDDISHDICANPEYFTLFGKASFYQ